MTDLREKIAAIVADERNDGDPFDIADAIIAALPDMVPDLVWERLLERNYISGDYCAYYTGCLFGGKLKYAWGYGTSARFGAETLEAAKDAANAHHRAQIMAALGVK